MCGVQISLGVDAGGDVCEGRLPFWRGASWVLCALPQLQESVLLGRAHGRAHVRAFGLSQQAPININERRLVLES